jgi:hypothetical protein
VVGHRCTLTTGTAHCASHENTLLDALARTLHVATGDHYLFYLCPEHGPESLEA